MLALANTANKSFRGKSNFLFLITDAAVNMEACIMLPQRKSGKYVWDAA